MAEDATGSALEGIKLALVTAIFAARVTSDPSSRYNKEPQPSES